MVYKAEINWFRVALVRMFKTVDWDLLGRYFGGDHEEEIVDFEYELYGRQTFRRDSGYFASEVLPDTAARRALGLLDELYDLSQEQGPGGMEEGVRQTRSPENSETVTTKSADCSVSSDGSVCGLQVRGSDRRCSSRPDSVPIVWPDPKSGCVHGGSCALFDGRSQKPFPCEHPPLQPIVPLPQRSAFAPGPKYTDDNGRRVMPFASRPRWFNQRKRCRTKS